MKKYNSLEIEIISFNKLDVLSASSIIGDNYFDNELPIVPIFSNKD